MSVFHTTPPNFSIQEAIDLAEFYYGINVHAKALDSDRDQNFYLNESNGQYEYVLKVSNPAESFDLLDMQNSAMKYIAKYKPPIHMTLPIPAKSGDEIISIEKGNRSHWVRLVQYVQGTFLKDSVHDEVMLYSLGAFLGELDSVLTRFKHPAADRSFPWDIRQIEILKENRKYLIAEKAAIVDHFIEQYEANVLPNVLQLRMAIIHNDGNDRNVLVDENGKTSGIIDFGDMVYTFIACEPAVCMAYIGLEKNDPFPAMASVLKGFHDSFPLTKTELAAVIYMVCIRSCISVTMAAYRTALFPDNPYLSVTENQAWDFLNKMKNEDLAKWSNKLIESVKR